MTELLNLALQAHGGLDRWNKVKAIKVAASITGAIWYVKSKGDFLKNVVLTAETRNERVTVDFPGQDKRAIFEPNRIVIETADGTLTEARDNPEESFEGQQRETRGMTFMWFISSGKRCGRSSTLRSSTRTKPSRIIKGRPFKVGFECEAERYRKEHPVWTLSILAWTFTRKRFRLR
jgi:hypothetical protein